MNKTENHTRHKDGYQDLMGATGSALASVGMQARNFTAAIESVSPSIAPGFYTTDSLAADVARLCDPGEAVSDTRLLNVAVKYFYAYVYEGAHNEPVSYSEIVALYEQFSRHQSMNEPSDDIEIMNRLRQWSSVLRVLADASRAAHIMRGVIGQHDAPICGGGPYVGVDIGAGTGLMLLALQIQARRNGFTDIQTLGYQTDPVSGERTHDLVHSLGAGSVMLADPNREGAYGMLRGRPISYVANEVLAGIQRSLTAENCFIKYEMFNRAVESNILTAAYFPEGLIAHSAAINSSVILAKENGFQPPAEFMHEKFTPQGLILEGKLIPIHKLGGDFYQYLT
ncbi:hypothetical protein [Pseudodesulfovibrio sediminis]|uniref:Uncharacterized protein n=1 Tax=Pseudodesulfovibrio sediminis TaxID=2810563 RepID=A0ABM7P3X6_9BACT|nr:hypothetical protein [Pseudodesulfovibrio sediminis]BCS87464.1 hypothetical protein PSDVSF_07060 [Pseudodesulfovibrio sediminis]